MKTLYLARHAKSSWKQTELNDIDRPLNKRGKQNAPLMGKVLKEKEVRPELILTSPAKRARKTSYIISEQIGYPKNEIISDENIYEASTNVLMELVHNLDKKLSSVMIFGHNPALTMFNNYLSDIYIDNIPTAGISAIQFDTDWNNIETGMGKSIFFIYPKLYLK
jgi:phosphohistidine phosphatase